ECRSSQTPVTAGCRPDDQDDPPRARPVPTAGVTQGMGPVRDARAAVTTVDMFVPLERRLCRGTVAVTLHDGRVLVAGGGTACGDVYNSAALFDSSTNTWSQAASMEAPSQFHVATRLGDGRVLVSGAATTVYDPQTALWAPLGDPRSLTEAPCE